MDTKSLNLKGSFDKDGIYHPGFTDSEKVAIDRRQNFHKHSSIKFTIEQRKELIKDMWNYLHDRFGRDFSEVILTHDSNFYDNSPLAWCHAFMRCLSLKNIDYERSSIYEDAYGIIKAVLYMNHDYIEFINIGEQFCTVRFSYDVFGNHFTLKYPYPVIKEKEETSEKLTEDLSKLSLTRSESGPVTVKG